MEPIIRLDLETRLKSNTPFRLELGCGPTTREGYLGIDRVPLPNVDIIADLETGLPFLPDNVVDVIHAESVLEHVDNFQLLMGDMWRVLKHSGKLDIFVPHFSNPYYYSDFTHRRFFGLYTFEYFSKAQTRYHRKVPNFYMDFEFRTEFLVLEFRSPWASRRIYKRLAQRMFNLNSWWQELYEQNFCYFIPCAGIRARLIPLK